MRKLPDRDWPATIVPALVAALALLLATFDRSCQHRDSAGDWSALTR